MCPVSHTDFVFAGRLGSGPVNNLAIREHRETHSIFVIIKTVVVDVYKISELPRTQESGINSFRQVDILTDMLHHPRQLVLRVDTSVENERRQVGEPFGIAGLMEVDELVRG